MVHCRLATACLGVLIVLAFAAPGLAREASVESSSAPPDASALAPVTDPNAAVAGESLVDPFLTEAGPGLLAPPLEPAAGIAPPASVDRVVAAWRAAAPTPQARIQALRRLRLEYGLGDLRAPAEALRRSAVGEDEKVAAALALELAPAMPALQWERARELWRGGEHGSALKHVVTLAAAMARELESQLWLIGNGLSFAVVVLLVAATALIAMLAIKAAPDAAHDLADLLSNRMPAFARAALLAVVVMAPLFVGEGLAGLVVVCFAIAFLYGAALERSALVMAAVLWVVALNPLARWAEVAAHALEEDPIARSALAISRGSGSRADVDRLEAAFDREDLAAHALALRARRFGEEADAKARLDALLARSPKDPHALANLGNLDMRAGQTESAIGRYERAAALLDSPSLLFDLSQAYASVLRMTEYETTIARAQAIGDREVAALSSLSDPRLVADLGFPVESVRDRLRARALAATGPADLSVALAPGRLGRDRFSLAGAFVLVAFGALLLGRRFDRSSPCKRCGHRICTRCAETVWSQDLCESCHHLFENVESTDAKLRMNRLQALSKREARVQFLTNLGALLIPGVAGLAARRADRALVSLLLVAFGVAVLRWPSGLIADAMWLGPVAPLLLGLLASLAFAGHAAIVLGSFVARRNR